MKKNTRKLFAVMLIVSMLFSLVPTATFAAPAAGMELQPYTNMEDLIQKAKDELRAQDAMVKPVVADDALVAAVEESGVPFDTAKSTISHDLFTNYTDGIIDVSRFGLSAADVDNMMQFVLRDERMTNDVTYQYDAQTGMIRYNMSDAMTAVLDGLAAMQNATAYDAAVIEDTAVTNGLESDAATPAVAAYAVAAAEEGHQHDALTAESTINFTWTEVGTNVVDENGEAVTQMVYDAANDAIGFEVKQTWDVTPSATYTCSCGEEVAIAPETTGYMVMDAGLQYVFVDTVLGTAYLTDSVITEKKADGTAYTLPDPEKEIKDANTGNVVTAVDNDPDILMLYQVMRAGAVLNVSDYSVIGQSVYDVSAMQALKAYNRMRELINGKTECFGVSTPFWTSKATETNPWGALKIVLNMEEDAQDVSTVYAQYIPDLTDGFAALVYFYEDALLAYNNHAMAKVEELRNTAGFSSLDDEVQDAYAMLILHDWLANYAVFDMSNLLASRESGGTGAVTLDSLLGMTPFTILSKGVGYKGGVCLGYTASYTYLVQNAFEENYYAGDFGGAVKDDANHIIDFVQIRFNSDVAESSVAGADSGFNNADGTSMRFNEPHFFNAAKLSGNSNWYYIDSCYDDANPEIISQYRVETDGNISHMYMLAAPATVEDQFEGSCDYIDSLYDGGYYVKPGSQQDINLGSDGKTLSGYVSYDHYKAAVEAGVDADGNGYDYTYYDAQGYKYTGKGVEPGWPKVANSTEGSATNDDREPVGYDDTTYEEAWFSNAQSEIILHDGNWYYVEGMNSYNSMKDMMDDMGDNMDQYMDQMTEQMDDPMYAHELKYRSLTADLTGSEMEGEGQNMTMNEDNFAYGLFHYGYGMVNYGITNDNADYENDDVNYPKLFAAEVEEDAAYRKMYPELSHGLGLYDGKLYFNLSNKIMAYDLATNSVSLIKEYNDVYAEKAAAQQGQIQFEGMAFTATAVNTTPDSYHFHFRYHPLAGLSIYDALTTYDNSPETLSQTGGFNYPVIYDTPIPTMYVSIGTNLTDSYENTAGQDYTIEAINYNSSYQRFMDEDKTDGEENTNVEFMWCANVVENMPMAELVADLTGATERVTIKAYCGQEGFTEYRTVKFGLSVADPQRTTSQALQHTFVWNDREVIENGDKAVKGIYICNTCKHVATDTEAANVENIDIVDLVILEKAIDDQTASSLDKKYDFDGNGRINEDDLKALENYLANLPDLENVPE